MARVMREATCLRLNRINTFADLCEKRCLNLLGKRRDN